MENTSKQPSTYLPQIGLVLFIVGLAAYAATRFFLGARIFLKAEGIAAWKLSAAAMWIAPIGAILLGHLSRLLSRIKPGRYGGRQLSFTILVLSYGLLAVMGAHIAYDRFKLAAKERKAAAKKAALAEKKQMRALIDRDRSMSNPILTEAQTFFERHWRYPESFEELLADGLCTGVSPTNSVGQPWGFSITALNYHGDTYKGFEIRTKHTSSERGLRLHVEHQGTGEHKATGPLLQSLQPASVKHFEEKGTLPDSPQALVDAGYIKAADLNRIRRTHFLTRGGWIQCFYSSPATGSRGTGKRATPIEKIAWSYRTEEAERKMRSIEKDPAYGQTLAAVSAFFHTHERAPKSMDELRSEGFADDIAKTNAFGNAWILHRYQSRSLYLATHVESDPPVDRAPHRIGKPFDIVDLRRNLQEKKKGQAFAELRRAVQSHYEKENAFPADVKVLMDAGLLSQEWHDFLKSSHNGGLKMKLYNDGASLKIGTSSFHKRELEAESEFRRAIHAYFGKGNDFPTEPKQLIDAGLLSQKTYEYLNHWQRAGLAMELENNGETLRVGKKRYRGVMYFHRKDLEAKK